MKRKALIVVAFALSGCGGPALSDRQRSQVSDEAADAAADAIASDSSIKDLKDEIETLKGEAEDYKTRVSALESDNRFALNSLKEAHQGNADNAREAERIREAYNDHLNRLHGVQ